MIYREIYQFGCEELTAADILEAALDARYLLEFVCGTDRNTLLVHGDREVSDEEEGTYKQLIAKRKTHIPLQHLTGSQDFMGLSFSVNENVLIPRQDTEVLVEEAMRQLHGGMRFLDMCTGSGCILLSLLHYSNECTGVGVDLSEKALEVAKENAVKLGLEKQASFIQSDLFETVEGQYDLVISNPPYIATEVCKTLMPEVKEHEPWMALDGKEDGLFFYRRIIEKCPEYIVRGGMLFFEIGYDQGEAVKDMMCQGGFKEVCVVQDFAGLDRVVYGTYY